MPRPSIYLIALLSLALLPIEVTWAFQSGKSEANNARQKCEAGGKLVVDGPFRANGLFVDGPDITEPMLRAAQLLGERRLAFVEFRRRPQGPNTMPKSAPRWIYLDFAEDLAGPELDEPYVRLSVAPITDPRCASFKRIIEKTRFLAMSYRWAGISPELCVAVDRVSQLAAPLERVFVRDEPNSKTTFGGWFLLRDRSSSAVHARVWSDGGRYCNNQDEYQRMDHLVQGPGSPLLGQLPDVLRVDEVTFPIKTRAHISSRGPEIPDPSTSPEWRYEPGPVRWDDLKSYGQLIDNANTSLEPYYERHRIPGLAGIGTGLAGYYLRIVRPGIRKNVRLIDGPKVFGTCDRLRREGKLLVIECSSYRLTSDSTSDSFKTSWGAWILLYGDDGSPVRIFEIDVGAADGRTQLRNIEVENGVPRRAVVNTSEATSAGNRQIYHMATIKIE